MRQRPKRRFAIVLRISNNGLFSPIAGYLEGAERVWQPSGKTPAAGSHRRKSIKAVASSPKHELPPPFIVPRLLHNTENLRQSDSLMTHDQTADISHDDLYTTQCLAKESSFQQGDKEFIDLFPRGDEGFS
jgi:hypothetical protein